MGRMDYVDNRSEQADLRDGWIADQEDRAALIKRLRELTSRWTDYEDIPGSQKAECKEIGKKLWHLGGMNLMQEAYYEAKDANRAASSIQPFWDGVGDWRW